MGGGIVILLDAIISLAAIIVPAIGLLFCLSGTWYVKLAPILLLMSWGFSCCFGFYLDLYGYSGVFGVCFCCAFWARILSWESIMVWLSVGLDSFLWEFATFVLPPFLVGFLPRL